MNEPSADEVRDYIAAELPCVHLAVEDDWHHFFATIVSREFEGLLRVRRHLAGAGISHATLELECESCEEHGPTCDLSGVRVGDVRDRRVPPG